MRWHRVLAVGAVLVTAFPGVAAAVDRSTLVVHDLEVEVDPGVGGRFGGRVDVDVHFRVVNRGTAPVQPTARIRVESQIGGGTTSAPIRLPSIPAGEGVDVARRIGSVLPFGSVHVVARVRADGQATSATASKAVIPWFLLAALLLVLAGVLIVRRALRAPQRAP